MTEVRPANKVVKGKPVFTIIPSMPLAHRFIQDNRDNLRDRTEAYTPVSRNKYNPALFHLRVYKSATSAFLLPKERQQKT